jgi:hypothetical protein
LHGRQRTMCCLSARAHDGRKICRREKVLLRSPESAKQGRNRSIKGLKLFAKVSEPQQNRYPGITQSAASLLPSYYTKLQQGSGLVGRGSRNRVRLITGGKDPFQNSTYSPTPVSGAYEKLWTAQRIMT